MALNKASYTAELNINNVGLYISSLARWVDSLIHGYLRSWKDSRKMMLWLNFFVRLFLLIDFKGKMWERSGGGGEEVDGGRERDFICWFTFQMSTAVEPEAKNSTTSPTRLVKTQALGPRCTLAGNWNGRWGRTQTQALQSKMWVSPLLTWLPESSLSGGILNLSESPTETLRAIEKAVRVHQIK